MKELMTMALGNILKEARLRRSLTLSQVSAAIQVPTYILHDIEREDFRKIPAPVYAKGFIKLYAQHVGVDPKPLLNEYMAACAMRSVIDLGSEVNGSRPSPDSATREPEREIPSKFLLNRQVERWFVTLMARVSAWKDSIWRGVQTLRPGIEYNGEDTEPAIKQNLKFPNFSKVIPVVILVVLLVVIIISTVSAWTKRSPKQTEAKQPIQTILRPVASPPEPYFEKTPIPPAARK